MPTASPARPNVVLIHCHDLGRHLGCYDRGVRTPHIDRLASEGVRFESAFCTAPQCHPSRAAMMTGQYPHEVGMLGHQSMGWSLDDDCITLPERLADAGYATALYGLCHVTDEPAEIGYDRVWQESVGGANVAGQFASELDELGDGGPFFATLGITEPHWPFRREYIDDGWYERSDPETVQLPPYLPDEPAVREDVAAYNALISARLDPAVGRIVNAIDDGGIAEETLVLFTTDHGVPFPRAKGSCYDPGLETALIARQPGRIDPASRDELLSNVDLLPTICDHVGGAVPEVSGRSFAPLLDGEGSYTERDRIYAELTYHDEYHPTRAVRTQDAKYIRNFDHGPSVYIPADILETETGAIMAAKYHGLDKRPEEEYYDLRADPHEQQSLAGDDTVFEPPADPDAGFEGEIEELRTDLHDWMVDTDDPLLEGPVSVPRAEQRPPFDDRPT
jgi:N-sulfoglucosamine sulfohydrolase